MLLCGCNKAADASKENESNKSEIGVETNTQSELSDVDNNNSNSGDTYYNEKPLAEVAISLAKKG